MKRKRLQSIFALIVIGSFTASSMASEIEENEFLNMDISELMQVTITSVSKKPQSLSEAAAAVFVITQEEIKKSGVTSIPEALRLAPGLHVARISSNKWAVTARGLNGFFANKLLVMIDGRTVYNPVFSGTYWDMLNTYMDDIDRIEVIRGPGATMWGANAVNGVINIITKHGKETVGATTHFGTGNHEEIIAGTRLGSGISDNVFARLYAQYNERESYEKWIDDEDANDNWENAQAGFRIDGDPKDNTSWKIHGDIYSIDENQIIEPYFINSFPYATENYSDVDGKGWNILASWEHKFSETSNLKIQSYYDYVQREEIFTTQTHKTFDFDVQYDNTFSEIHNITLGIGYRNIDSTVTPTFQVYLDDESRNDELFSGFIQDVITLQPEKLYFTLGTKWEHNDMTGNELQPTARILWKATDTQSFWTSVSRAVRTPAQIEDSGNIVFAVDPRLPPYPAVFTVEGNSDFDSEEVLAYETGYRFFPSSSWSFDLALFYNEYDDVLGTTPSPTLTDPYRYEFANLLKGESYGAEIVTEWKPMECFKLSLSYTYLYLDFEPKEGNKGIGSADIINNGSPRHQVSLRTSFQPMKKLQTNLWLRYVGELEIASNTADELGVEVDEYTELDINIIWNVTEKLEFSLVGQNLLNESHLEYVSEFLMMPVEIGRSFYLKATYNF